MLDIDPLCIHVLKLPGQHSERRSRLPYSERLPEPIKSIAACVARPECVDAQLQVSLVQVRGARKTQSWWPRDLGVLLTGPPA